MVEDRLESSDDDDYHDERTGMLSASYDQIHRLALPPHNHQLSSTPPPTMTPLSMLIPQTTPTPIHRLRPVSMHAWITSSCKALHNSYTSSSNSSTSHSNTHSHSHSYSNTESSDETHHATATTTKTIHHTSTQTSIPLAREEEEQRDFKTSSLRHISRRHQPDLVKDLQRGQTLEGGDKSSDMLAQDRRLRFRSFFRWRSLKSRLMPTRNCHSLQPQALSQVNIKMNTPTPTPLPVRIKTQQVTHLRRPNPIIIVENYDHRNVQQIRTQILLHPQSTHATWGQIVNADEPKAEDKLPHDVASPTTPTQRKWRLWKAGSHNKTTTEKLPAAANRSSCSSIDTCHAAGFCGPSSSSLRSKTKCKSSTSSPTNTTTTTNNSNSSNSCIAQ